MRPIAEKPARPRKRRRNESAGAQSTAESLFPVVAIGASAGGLEALEQFLSQVPARSGMGFVVVQHLDPTRKGMLVELLLRMSPIPVVQVIDGTAVKPDHVYVIPPNADMSIVHGVLHLLEPVAPRGLRLPIDFFFRSLADDRLSYGGAAAPAAAPRSSKLPAQSPSARKGSSPPTGSKAGSRANMAPQAEEAAVDSSGSTPAVRSRTWEVSTPSAARGATGCA